MWRLILASCLILALIGSANAMSVEWYQLNAKGVYEKVDFVVQDVGYKAVITVLSDENKPVTVRIIEDIPYWFDKEIKAITVMLHEGWNRIEIPFVLHDRGVRGVFVKIDGILDVQSVSDRFASGYEIAPSSYYFGGMSLYINGQQYDTDVYAPVPSKANVMVIGLLYGPDGDVVPNFDIRAYTVTGDELNTKTDSSGTFRISWKCPDWSEYNLCNRKMYIFRLQAIDSDGTIVASWEVTATGVCEAEEPSVKFDVVDVWIKPEKPKANEEVDIYATIKNVGDSTQTGKVLLFINNVQHSDVKEVTLKPGESTTVSWWYIFLKNGTYTITVMTDYDKVTKTIVVGSQPTTTPTPPEENTSPEQPTPTNMSWLIPLNITIIAVAILLLSLKKKK